jgi:predicted N-formylglutamate amidohydrolase
MLLFLVSFDERERRIMTFYMPYYMILLQALSFLKPKYVISSHSFTAQYEDQARREFEVGILFRENNILIDKVIILISKIFLFKIFFY